MVEQLKRAKTLKGWKTILFNIGAISPIALDLIGYLISNPNIQGLIPEGYMDEYVLAMGVVNLILRYITTTPMGSKY